MNCNPLLAVYSKLHCLIPPKVATAIVNSASYKKFAHTHFATSGSTLPFTGFDLTLIALAGLFLIVLGFGIRRIGRNA